MTFTKKEDLGFIGERPPISRSLDHTDKDATPNDVSLNGAYYLEGTFLNQNVFGILRFEISDEFLSCSSDIYLSPPSTYSTNNLPIFPRESYYQYWNFDELLEISATSLKFLIRPFQLDPPARWPRKGVFDLSITINSGKLVAGTLERGGSVIGELQLRWTSSFFRDAAIQFARVQDLEIPTPPSSDLTWDQIFKPSRWHINQEPEVLEIQHPRAKSIWTPGDLHEVINSLRGEIDHDQNWKYLILIVENILNEGYMEIGLMFDRDRRLDDPPREAAALAANWSFPLNSNPPYNPLWCDRCTGTIAQQGQAYYRTAIHEIGHAMWLLHKHAHNCSLMSLTKQIAKANRHTFPDSIKWEFSGESILNLKHLPDAYVRPGMLRFGRDGFSYRMSAPIPSQEGLDVVLKPLRNSFPLGAPVRLNIAIRNHTGYNIKIPERLGLNSESIEVHVELGDHYNIAKSSLRVATNHELIPLEDGEEICGLTLFDGINGPLFPKPGTYTVIVVLNWYDGESSFRIGERIEIEVIEKTADVDSDLIDELLKNEEVPFAIELGTANLEIGTILLEKASKSGIRDHFSFNVLRAFALSSEKNAGFEERITEELSLPETLLTVSERKEILELIKSQ